MKDVSKEFEKDFKKKIGEIKNRTIFLYIGSDMFDINMEKWKTPVEDARFFIVDFNNISLR
jgi:putative sterol carrier protein